MAMKSCGCSGGEEGETCRACGGAVTLSYWCENCRRAVAGKRCPLCGLKAKRMKI